MYIIKINGDGYDLYCPQSGEPILLNSDPGLGVGSTAKSFMACWNQHVFLNPEFKSKEMKKAWEEFIADFKEYDDFPELDRERGIIEGFLSGYKKKDGIALRIDTTEFEGRFTAYFALDL